MNKILAGLIALTVLAAGVPANALDSYSVKGQPNGQFLVPEAKNGVDDLDRQWSQPSICRAEKSLTCVQCESAAAGMVVDLEVDSGVTGGFAAAFDTISLAGEVATVPLAGTLITEQQTAGAAANTVAESGHKKFADGAPFFGGLVLCNSSTDTYSILKYRVLRKP